MKRQEWYRLTNSEMILSVGRDMIFQVWDLFSPAPFSRLYQKVKKHTVCSNARLRSLYCAVQHAVRENIPGDLVECGTARGGSAALMALACRQAGIARTLWAFDTFDGLPAPSQNDPDFEIADLYTGQHWFTQKEVTAFFDSLGILNSTILVKGLIQETLPKASIKEIAVLHIDTDWYDSVLACLNHLYDRVSSGGIIQFDDYGHWQGARKAVDNFLKERYLNVPLYRIDYAGRQLVKP